MDNANIRLTDLAATRLGVLRDADHNPGLKLRLSVSGGGCSGFKYDFALDEHAAESDVQIVNRDAVLLIDRSSLPFVDGATIDYQDDLTGARFVVRNPNAAASCGCGNSFTVD